jgi:N-acetylmuramoyl-L-alanine amidase CwlA
MLQIQQKFINFNKTNRSVKPSYIVVHDTADPSATAQNEHDYFNGGDRQASADIFVDDNNIIQIIDTDNCYSWAVGDGRGNFGITNSNSMSVEMCLDASGNPSESTINNTLDTVRYFMSKYEVSIDRVVRHYDASRKCCPCSFSANNWSKWNEFKSRLAGQAPVQNQSIEQNNNVEGDFMAKKYSNGSTSEPVFQTETCTNQIGSLDPWEQCDAIADVDGKIVVLYNSPNGKKVGFVKYRAGL